MATYIQLIITPATEGLMYSFDEVGEGLMMHDHNESTAHDIHVIQGSVVIYGEVPRTVIKQGETFKFDWTKPHEVVALEDKTVIYNRLLNGVPADVRNIPFDQRQGSMEDTLHNPIKYY